MSYPSPAGALAATGFRSPCLAEIARWAQATPHAPALLSPGDEPLSFSEFLARVARVAGVLQEAGAGPGDLVTVAMPEGPELLCLLLGALEACAAAPLDWKLTEAELDARLALIPACALVTCSSTGSLAAERARASGIPVIEISFAADGDVLGTLPAPACASGSRRRVTPDCALVLQTSATTGAPKLVPLTHKNIHAACAGQQRGLAMLSSDRYLGVMPHHHILGFSCSVGQLMAGGSVACTGFDLQRLTAWLDELRPTWYAGGPALHQTILEIARHNPASFQRAPLQFVRCGSGAGSPTLLNELEQVLQINVINGYGLTEAGSVTNTPPHLGRKPGSVGRTIGPEIGIMDESGGLLPPDCEGEVVLRGDAVMAGYLNDPEANAEVLRDGWFHTGDLGRLDEEGDLFITGRIKEIINRGGETIAPLEVDHAAAAHPAVASAASFAVAHPTLGEDVALAVVLRPGMHLSAAEIRGFLTGRLSRSKIPSRVWFTESIPLSASGKPLRNILRAQIPESASMAEQPDSSSAAPGLPATHLTRRIAQVWMQVLNTDTPTSHDNFFGQGGDSLAAARMFTLLEQEFQFRENVAEYARFFDSPTLSELEQIVAHCLSANGAQNESQEIHYENVSAVQLQRQGDGPPIFFFPGEGLEPWDLRHLVRHLGEERPFVALRHNLADPREFDAVAGRFTRLISDLRPSGPIMLAGHCYGGILAYEVALRLSGRAASNLAVVLVDVATPGYPKARVRGYLRYLPRVMSALLHAHGRQVARELVAHLKYLQGIRAEIRSAQQELAPAAIAQRTTTLTPGGVLLRSYVPRIFSGRLINVFASGHEVSARVLEDARRGWRDFARGPYQEFQVAGWHNSLFTESNAAGLARVIASVSQSLQPASQQSVMAR